MPRNGRRGRKDGLAEDSSVRSVARTGGGAHSPDISTQPPLIVRPDGPPVSYGGMQYNSYSAAPVRRHKLQVVSEPVGFHILGRHRTNASPSVETTFASLLRVEEVWDEAYQQWIYAAESRDAYRHLPKELNNRKVFRYMITLYMQAVAMLNELTCWQKLTMFDRGHRAVGFEVARISIGRTNTAWESLTSFPMPIAFHQYAMYASMPVVGLPTDPVYHRLFPMPEWQYAFGTSGDFPYRTVGVDGASLWPDQAGYAGNILDTVNTVIKILSGLASTVSDNDQEDIYNVLQLFRMTGLKPNPTKWRDVNPLVMDQALLDQRMYRGLMVGEINVTSGTNKQVSYPIVEGSDAVTLVERRGMGTPTPLIFCGMESPWGANVGSEDVNAEAPILYGSIGFATQNASNLSRRGSFRAARLFTPSDGFFSEHTQVNNLSQVMDPYLHHEYAKRLNTTSVNINVRVSDAVDWEFYMPAEDIGLHYLAWTSQALGLPFVLSG